MNDLPYSLEKSVEICAGRDLVFRYFTDSVRFASWWGEGSHIDPTAGGEVFIRYPDGSTARGKIVEISPPERVVFTYGYENPSAGLPPEASLVAIRLSETPGGTLVTLRHDLPTEALRDHHVQGWRYQLALFANVAAREAQARADERVNAYLSAWNEPDAAARRSLLETAVTGDIAFRDAFGCVAGIEELNANLAAVQTFMPGMKLQSSGELRQCQGTALGDWRAEGPDGSVRAKGVNVYEFSPDGRIRRVVGFWERA